MGYGQLSRVILNIIQLTDHSLSIFVGILLSDAWLIHLKPHWSPKVEFCQSIKHFDYFWHVFRALAHYCHSYPCLVLKKARGLIYPALQFETRALACFNELLHLFIVNGVKAVPTTIFDLLTPVALAHWIIGDGFSRNGGVGLATDSYSISDCVLLLNVLIIKYDLDVILYMHMGKPRLLIKKSSMGKLRSLVLDHMPSSMHYKLCL